jgi:PKHD-type hydroxylase
MRAGDMVVYKGCDITHWRTPFKGDESDWCVQLFIHYTDAEGPYKHLKYDGRDKLGMKKDRPKGMHPDRVEQNGEQQANQIMFGNPIFGGILLPRYVEDYPGYSYLDPKAYPDLTFTEEECEKIIDIQRKSYGSPASVGGGDQGRIVKEIRKADVYEVPMDRFAWVYEKIARSVQVLNEGYFKFDLLGITHGLQLLHYKYNPEEDVQGHYDWHQDVGPGASSYRKISYVAMLSDPYKYKGGSLELMNINGGTVAPKDRGGVHMFPSYMMHRVTPLEEGERFSLVIWVHGPYRFR